MSAPPAGPGAPPAGAPPWWHPARHAARRPKLLARNRITAALRAWMADEGFTEVEPAALVITPGAEAHLRALATDLRGADGAGRRLHLHTSPELACKKLLAAGETRIAAIARVWRDGERGALHHPEFTLLEWYRVGAPLDALVDDCAALLRLAAGAAGASALTFRGLACDPLAPVERLTVAEAFAAYAGVDLLATLDAAGVPDRDALAAQAARAGERVAPDDTWADLFSKLLVARVEPRLGVGRATALTDYPAPLAALARRREDDPRVAERFELYACGVELANAFGELTDPAEQRRRFAAEMDEKLRLHGEDWPVDEEFLAALALVPPTSGAALGLDRLVMLAAGAARVEEVLWSPVPGGD